ncbi:hypothetical protein BU14_0187s0012 [Porphyra umbilicalis]|uniref:Uncharacterized protein n=1 Tax=Porphyra umbilicalis TaxID=2786 RepID=A0A1X6P6M1_PORUM|nr:hypothetical protein BU14_0187s0012 [Porphyra umbilicalis]|eukprot:OSX76532.1 hypothetical protein BU14_0187s0012 [Porphyra umbilicalis]
MRATAASLGGCSCPRPPPADQPPAFSRWPAPPPHGTSLSGASGGTACASRRRRDTTAASLSCVSARSSPYAWPTIPKPSALSKQRGSAASCRPTRTCGRRTCGTPRGGGCSSGGSPRSSPAGG